MTAQTVDTPGPRVALIGAGGIAGAHLPGWLELDAQVTIYAQEAANELASDAGCVVAGSLQEAISGCDIVDVCTPTPAHRGIVESAAAAGKHVLCEKPLGRTSADALAAIEACREAGVQLYPGHVVRFFSEYAAMHEAVAAGRVGTIAVQRFSRTGSRPERAWYHDEQLSGGIILDQLIHDLDFARWNAGDVHTAFARLNRGGNPADPVTTAQVILTHDSGAISYVNGTWAPPGTTFRTSFEIAGTDGVLRHDSAENPAVRIDAAGPEESGTGLLPAAHGRSPFTAEIAEFAAAFADGSCPPRVTAEDGHRAILIAEAANESVQLGRPVPVARPRVAARREVPA